MYPKFRISNTVQFMLSVEFSAYNIIPLFVLLFKIAVENQNSLIFRFVSRSQESASKQL
jgi:hypothetical protein